MEASLTLLVTRTERKSLSNGRVKMIVMCAPRTQRSDLALVDQSKEKGGIIIVDDLRKSSRTAMTTLAVMSAIAMGANTLPMGAPLFDASREITPDEKKYLATLDKTGREIWTRRLRRGLSESEREFFNEKMEIARGDTTDIENTPCDRNDGENS
jgi:hypothetical protein